METNRPKHWVWRYFTRNSIVSGNKTTIHAGCNFCAQTYVVHPDRMVKHLLRCERTPPVIKARIKAKIEQETQSKMLQNPSGSTDVNYEEDPSDGPHLFSENDKKFADNELTEAFCTAGIAHAFVENPAFKKFIKRLNPGYKLPTRHVISQDLIPSKYQDVKREVDERIRKAPFVTLGTDGWSDVRRNAIINMIVYTPSPFLYKSIDTGMNSHTGEYIADVLSEVIQEIGPEKVVEIISDHASNMQSAWRIIQTRFPWIVVNGCKAHLLDLACSDVCKDPMVSEVIKLATNIAKFFSRRTPHFLLDELQNYLYGRRFPICLPSNIKWGTNRKLISAVFSSHNAILQILRDHRIRDHRNLEKAAKKLRPYVIHAGNINMFKEVENILKPLTDAITMIEGDDLDIVEAYLKVNQAFDTAYSESENIVHLGEESKANISQDLLYRKQFGNSSVFYLVRMLDPRDKGESLTDDQKAEGFEVFQSRILQNPLFLPHKHNALVELAQWQANTGVFGDPNRSYSWECLNSSKIDAMSWWLGFYPNTIIARIVSSLKPIQITSAACERYWSIRGWLHSKVRNRLSSRKADMESYINFNLKHLRPFKGKQKKLLESESLEEMENGDSEPLEDQGSEAENQESDDEVFIVEDDEEFEDL